MFQDPSTHMRLIKMHLEHEIDFVATIRAAFPTLRQH